jgi:hypothetical protein
MGRESIIDVQASAAEAIWDLWYEDTFDREAPRRVELTGRGMLEGLVQLWARTLTQTVQPGGQRGFARFNLWWRQAGRSIEVRDEGEGLTKLRAWIYGARQAPVRGPLDGADRTLLTRLAAAHRTLILAGEEGAALVSAAAAARDRPAFEAVLVAILTRAA